MHEGQDVFAPGRHAARGGPRRRRARDRRRRRARQLRRRSGAPLLRETYVYLHLLEAARGRAGRAGEGGPAGRPPGLHGLVLRRPPALRGAARARTLEGAARDPLPLLRRWPSGVTPCRAVRGSGTRHLPSALRPAGRRPRRRRDADPGRPGAAARRSSAARRPSRGASTRREPPRHPFMAPNGREQPPRRRLPDRRLLDRRDRSGRGMTRDLDAPGRACAPR